MPPMPIVRDLEDAAAAVGQRADQHQLPSLRAGYVVGQATAPPNMTVAAYNFSSGTRRGFTATDASGNFESVLPPGSYKIAAYDETLTYAPVTYTETVTIAAAASVTVNLTLPLAAKIAGVVSDRTTSAPIAGARATVYAGDGSVAAQTLTGSDGRYALAAKPGALRVVVDDPAGNYATTYVPDAESFSAEREIGAVAGQTVTLNATMVRAGHLTGRVTDHITGSPLAGITAVAYNLDGTTRAFATTDANVPTPSSFPPAITASASSTRRCFISRSSIHSLRTWGANRRAAASNSSYGKGARVTGHVTARATGTPLAAITVAAYDLLGRRITSANTDASAANFIPENVQDKLSN